MKNRKSFGLLTAVVLGTTLVLGGCGSSGGSGGNAAGGDSPSTNASSSPSAGNAANGGGKAEGGKVTITVGAYSILQKSLDAIFPLFQEKWKQEHGQTVEFKESYQASGSQATAIIQGFDADIAPLSLEGDVDKIVKAGLITNDWKSKPHGGMITTSVAAIGVREGNPKGIKDWSDLTQSGVELLVPNPSTSGGAKWDINAVYGAGLKLSEEAGAQDPEKAKQLVSDLYKNIKVLDKSGADSLTTFDSGVGDAIITYENELIARIHDGQKYEVVVPNYTIKIENPVALVDKNVDKHGNREAVEAFLDFLWSPEAQKVFSQNGFRSVDPDVLKDYADQYVEPAGLFDIGYLGGWDKVNTDLYGKGALWETILAEGGSK